MKLNEYKIYKVPVLGSSKDCNVIKTSSRIDFENFCNNTKVVRILTKNNDIIMWDAQELNHKDVSDNLLLDDYNVFWIESGILHWHYKIDWITAEDFLSLWYPSLVEKLDKDKREIKLF